MLLNNIHIILYYNKTYLDFGSWFKIGVCALLRLLAHCSFWFKPFSTLDTFVIIEFVFKLVRTLTYLLMNSSQVTIPWTNHGIFFFAFTAISSHELSNKTPWATGHRKKKKQINTFSPHSNHILFIIALWTAIRNLKRTNILTFYIALAVAYIYIWRIMK